MCPQITIDGQDYEAESGAMIIEIADKVGIHIPRFCYHPHLSIAANCRMCLVETSSAPKPVPACATPITDGMIVSTKSKKTRESQQAIMEFLLINHPLDCPICDQGGECELQDHALQYGHDHSLYHEEKRVADDCDLGSLVATDLTRCIQCTRCVRFGSEIAGVRELGAPGRGEHMHISTYLKHELTSELSGNIIDLCPVGALTSKPNRYAGRSWEFKQKEGLPFHDSTFSALNWNFLHQQLKRVTPRSNPELNQVWLSDRDRFSYLGLQHEERLTSPMIKKDGQWHEVALIEAYEFVRDLISKNQTHEAFYHPLATAQEVAIFQRYLYSLDKNCVPYQLKTEHLLPEILPFSLDVLRQQSLLILGPQLALDHPIIAHHIRQGLMQGNKVFHVTVMSEFMGMQGLHQKILAPQYFEQFLDTLIQASESSDSSFIHALMNCAAPLNILISSSIAQFVNPQLILEKSKILAARHKGKVGVLGMSNALGGLAQHNASHKRSSDLLWILHAEPEDWNTDKTARDLVQQAKNIVAFVSYKNKLMMTLANVLFPVGLLAENEGDYLNCLGQWQKTTRALKKNDTPPAWQLLADLQKNDAVNNISNISYNTSPQSWPIVKSKDLLTPLTNDGEYTFLVLDESYAVDSVVRRSQPLEALPDTRLRSFLWVSESISKKFNIVNGQTLTIHWADGFKLQRKIYINQTLAEDVVIYWTGRSYESHVLQSGPVTLSKDALA